MIDPRDDPLTAALDALLRCDQEAREILRATHLGGISEHARRIRETVAEILPQAEIERAEERPAPAGTLTVTGQSWSGNVWQDPTTLGAASLNPPYYPKPTG